MKFKTKLLSAAVLAAVGATSAQAVVLSQEGIGNVLLYPYYTVEGGYQTLFSVVNTTNHGKAVKVRFLESLNSREVLDFNLYLSPHDVWTGMVDEDAGGGARVVVHSSETSCTVPAISTSLGGSGSQAFLTFGFDGNGEQAADAHSTDGVARTRSGYIELIEMGDIDPEYQMDDGTTFLTNITHTNGVLSAAKCGVIAAEWDKLSAAFPDAGYGTIDNTGDIAGLMSTTGGLMGSGTLIDIAAGTDYSYDPVALAGFFQNEIFHTTPGSMTPSLENSTNINVVFQIDQEAGTALPIETTWEVEVGSTATTAFDGIDAVSSLLMRSAVLNEYVVNPLIHAKTDWVVTFPTKKWYTGLGVLHPVRPFSSLFGVNGACETVTFVGSSGVRGPFDQEEQHSTGKSGFSPAPVGGSNSLCWEANVITFNQTTGSGSVLATTQNQNVDVKNYPGGWMALAFPSSSTNMSWYPDNANTAAALPDLVSHRMPTDTARVFVTAGAMDANVTFTGLPVIGFAVQEYLNDVQAGYLSNYGGAFIHKYERSIGFVTTQLPPIN